MGSAVVNSVFNRWIKLNLFEMGFAYRGLSLFWIEEDYGDNTDFKGKDLFFTDWLENMQLESIIGNLILFTKQLAAEGWSFYKVGLHCFIM